METPGTFQKSQNSIFLSKNRHRVTIETQFPNYLFSFFFGMILCYKYRVERGRETNIMYIKKRNKTGEYFCINFMKNNKKIKSEKKTKKIPEFVSTRKNII